MWTRAPVSPTEKELSEPLTTELLARSTQYKTLLAASSVNQDGLVAHSVVLWDTTKLEFFPGPTSSESEVTFPPESATKSVVALQEATNKASRASMFVARICCMVSSRKRGMGAGGKRIRSGSGHYYIPRKQYGKADNQDFEIGTPASRRTVLMQRSIRHLANALLCQGVHDSLALID